MDRTTLALGLVALAAASDGDMAQLSICDEKDPAQQWVLRTGAWGTNNTLVNFHNGGTTPQCLDIPSWAVSKEGASVQSYHCVCENHTLCPGQGKYPAKNYNEQWTFEAKTGHIRIMDEHRQPGLCLEATQPRDGAPLQLWECDATRNAVQKWMLNTGNASLPLIRLLSHDDDGDDWCLSTAKGGAPTPTPSGPTPPPTPNANAFPCVGASVSQYPWCDTGKSADERALLLAQALTPAEAATQLSTFSFTRNHSGSVPGVPRLRLPPYNYHSEGLHGVRDSCDGEATLWPQVVAMAATGNLTLVHEMGRFMGQGFRAAANVLRSDGEAMPNKGCGLSVYGPTINIIRDPRWGRNQESVSEDPWLR
jgi:hypothetical protein